MVLKLTYSSVSSILLKTVFILLLQTKSTNIDMKEGSDGLYLELKIFKAQYAHLARLKAFSFPLRK